MQPRQIFSTLLTPGPVTLSVATKREMLIDHAMDGAHIEAELKFCRDALLEIANAKRVGTAIPLSGSATSASEAAVQTFVPPSGKVLVCSNGVFGDRFATICRAMRLRHRTLRGSPVQPLPLSKLAALLDADPDITHVVAVHCETSSGIINPVKEIAKLCRTKGRKLLIDAVSSFGALPIDFMELECEALILGINKCLQSPPGLAWVIADIAALQGCEGNARSLTLDLWDQWQHIELNGSFRFTPPTHTIAAFAQALREYQEEGGQEARLTRYTQNRDRLLFGLRRLGFRAALPYPLAAPMVLTVYAPDLIAADQAAFAERLTDHGFQISLRRTAVPGTLRFGCMGEITPDHMTRAASTIGRILNEMDSVAVPLEARTCSDGARSHHD